MKRKNNKIEQQNINQDKLINNLQISTAELINKFSILSHATLMGATSFFAFFWSLILAYTSGTTPEFIISFTTLSTFAAILTFVSIIYFKKEKKIIEIGKQSLTRNELKNALRRKVWLKDLFLARKWYLIWIVTMWFVHISGFTIVSIIFTIGV